MRRKLRDLGLRGAPAGEITAALITEGYLNEERYARAFAGGKFRMKHWGRRRILHALKAKEISPYCLDRAMEEISEEDYRRTLEKLARDKYQALRAEAPPRRRHKTAGYLLAKGYEPELVREALETVTEG